MTVLTVGPGQQFATIDAAVVAANPGDTIDVQAGIYTNDFIGIYKNLTLQAVGGVAQLVATVDSPNGKAIVDEGGAGIAVTINGFDISGAVVPDGNGAAIRYEGGSLSLNDVYFHNNQEGLLGAADPNGTISVDHSEFAFNGDGSGFTHNIYAGRIASLVITNSYFHDANEGHEIKSRAANTTITNDRIFDNNGTASYSIDLPNGSNATIQNDVIEQGPFSDNPNIIAYGEEGVSNPGTNVLIADNTIVNDLPSSNAQVILNRSSTPLNFTDNQVYGTTRLVNGPLNASGTVFLTTRPTLDTSSTWDVGLLCFSAGTRIATPTHEARVEELRIGDLVVTAAGAAKSIRWIGRRRLERALHPRPDTVAPIRIQCGAFADNMPHSDLVVSPDHAIFVDGKLICARQLVNGTTIRQESGWVAVDYYHVELDQHAILLAEGLPAESYLDTGNRGFFGNSGAPLVLHPDLTDATDYPTREAGSCAPFVWDEAHVRPVWQHLADRATVIGTPVPQRVTTTEANPRILAEHYERKPVYSDSNLLVFVLPCGAKEVRLLSRAQSPTMARPWLDDRRRLGVRAQRIVLRGMNELREIPMDHPGLTKGWWDIERDGQVMSRWTNGDAVVPLPKMDGHVMLEIHLTGEMIYTVEAEPERHAA
jgi:hypothetical protein